MKDKVNYDIETCLGNLELANKSGLIKDLKLWNTRLREAIERLEVGFKDGTKTYSASECREHLNEAFKAYDLRAFNLWTKRLCDIENR